MSNTYKFFNDTKTASDRARAEAAAGSAEQAVIDAGEAAQEAIDEGLALIAVPSRVVNVFAGASNVAPNFDTFSGALTYANSLAPSTTEPVAIRLFAKADGTPYEITGPDDWYALALQGIYVSSPFDAWGQYVLYGGTLTEADLLWTIDESKLAITVTG